jgi:hypothetical protein
MPFCTALQILYDLTQSSVRTCNRDVLFHMKPAKVLRCGMWTFTLLAQSCAWGTSRNLQVIFD